MEEEVIKINNTIKFVYIDIYDKIYVNTYIYIYFKRSVIIKTKIFTNIF